MSWEFPDEGLAVFQYAGSNVLILSVRILPEIEPIVLEDCMDLDLAVRPHIFVWIGSGLGRSLSGGFCRIGCAPRWEELIHLPWICLQSVRSVSLLP